MLCLYYGGDRGEMRVKLYIAEVQDHEGRGQMLVLEDGPAAAIPLRLQDREWRFVAVTESNDPRIPGSPDLVTAALARDGHCVLVVEPPAPD